MRFIYVGLQDNLIARVRDYALLLCACPLVMFDTTDFLSDPILNKIQAGTGDTNPIQIFYANTPNVSGKSKNSSAFQIIAS